MEEEEDQAGQRFVCKFCNKICSSGKSLGGHMRVHVASIAAKKKQQNAIGGGFDDHEENPNIAAAISQPLNNALQLQETEKESDVCFEDCGQTSYGLRDNPKKSWRVSDSKHRTLRKKHFCEECGKGFHTRRALSGHKRCHGPMKEKQEHICTKCGKEFDSMRAVFGHMRSHSKRHRFSVESAAERSEFETLCPIRRKRSRMRYKIAPNFSFSNLNAKSYVAEKCELKEVEEAALGLIMLSRGVRDWVGLNMVTGSSDNNSFTSAPQSHQRNVNAANECQSMELACDADDILLNKPVEKFDTGVLGAVRVGCGQNAPHCGDSGSQSPKSTKMVELETLLARDNSQKPKADDQCANQRSANEMKETIDYPEVELGKVMMLTEFGENRSDGKVLKPNSTKKNKVVAFKPEVDGNGAGITSADAEFPKDLAKKNEYKCKTCGKIFPSHRALGGHRTRHKQVSNSSSLMLNEENRQQIIQRCLLIETEASSELEKPVCDENSLEQGINEVWGTGTGLGSQKSRDHECPICFRVFATGQALGGHKRAHYMSKETLIVQQEVPEILDLNVPVTTGEGSKLDAGLEGMAWWVGSGPEHQPLLITN